MPGLLRAALGVLLSFAPFAAWANSSDGGEAVGVAVAAASMAPGTAPTPKARFTLPRPDYPATRRDPLVDRMFGEDVADPYRWLEADIRISPDVANWVARQNTLSAGYLASLPGRDAMASRIRGLFDFERFGLPRKAGRQYFYLRNSGLQNQSALYVRDGAKGAQRLLLDPNQWTADGSAALAKWEPARSGSHVAYAMQEAGSDWRAIRVLEVRSGRVLDERLQWANDTEIGWVGDEGFFYSRFPAPAQDAQFSAPTYNKAVWFHRVGTPQAQDELVYATPEQPGLGHKAVVTSDGRWAVITTEASTDARHAVHVIDLARRGEGPWIVKPLVPELAWDWKLVEGMGNRLWFLTNQGAPQYRLVQVDLSRPDLGWREVIRESAQRLGAAKIVGDRLLLSYQRDGESVAVVTDLKGRPSRAITLTGYGTASGFGGRPGDPETFYQFTSFNQPPAIFRMNLRSGLVTPFAVPEAPFDPADYVVEQRTFPSKDGTRVPMYIVRSRKLAQSNRPAPTLLYGYGGFDISLTPSFSPVRMAWLETGGVFALANIRGGGEFGRAWHDAGKLGNKQNSFDDFIAAGEFLIREGITPAGGLAVQGGSNGGLLVGAVVNQRPDLFAAANPDVGVMDMLRFDRFTAGRYWVDDYGRPDREADWRTLRAYSPYHNIGMPGGVGQSYPAILVTTADTDDRVVPAHSFKYVAALQSARIGDKPHLLRVEARAGHGAGKPVDKVISGGADVLSFLAYWTSLPIE